MRSAPPPHTQIASARLAEEEHAATASKQPPPGAIAGRPHPSLAKVDSLWAWQLDAPLDAAADTPDSLPARSLARVLLEAEACLLSAAWHTRHAEVQTAFVPLATAAPDKAALALLLGRVHALLAADREATRLVLPMLTDTLAARRGDIDAEVYAVGRAYMEAHKK